MAERTLAALVLAGMLAACDSPLESPAAPELSIQASHLTAPRSQDLNRGLADLTRATARFHNFEAAAEAGYEDELTVCWYHSELGAMGYHYGDEDLIDGEVSLLEPEILVYEPKRNGSFRLVAMEYIVPIDAWQGDELPSLLGQAFHDNGAGLYILHIWRWRHNPRGMFADWNPKVSCEHAADSENRGP